MAAQQNRRSTGLDRAEAPPPAKAREMLSEVSGSFWAVYIGGPWNGGIGWTPSLVHEYVQAGIHQFLPTFVGQQLPGGTLTAGQGFKDGQWAVHLMKGYGWTHGAPCALDVEKPTSDGNLEGAVAYADGFCVALHQAGYLPGVYASPDYLARLWTEKNRPQFIWAASWVTSTVNPNQDPAHIPGLPDAVWNGSRVWQYGGAGLRAQVGDLQVDIDVAGIPLAPAPTQGHPQSQARTYTVEPGDTLTSIAQAHHVTLAALTAANPQIQDPNLIHVGEVIHLP